MCEELKDVIFDSVATELHNKNRHKSLKSHNEQARKIIDASWNTLEGKLARVPGKEFISR